MAANSFRLYRRTSPPSRPSRVLASSTCCLMAGGGLSTVDESLEVESRSGRVASRFERKAALVGDVGIEREREPSHTWIHEPCVRPLEGILRLPRIAGPRQRSANREATDRRRCRECRDAIRLTAIIPRERVRRIEPRMATLEKPNEPKRTL